MPLFSKLPQVRQWDSFLEFASFQKPTHAAERVATNVGYWMGNYLAIGLGLLCVCLIMKPALLLAALVLGVGHIAVKRLINDPKVTASLGMSTKALARLSVYASFCLLFFVGGNSLLSTTTLWLLIVLGHALFRKRSLKARAVHFVDIYNDFGPISSIVAYLDDSALAS